MKAIAYEKYGSADVLELKEVRKPEIEGDRVLVRILAASANPYDWHFMRGVPYIARPAAMGVRKPNHTLLGSDVAGEVEAVGNAVTRFRPGDEVFGFVGEGGFAEYVSAPERLLALKPINLSFEKAATVPLAAVTALQGLRDAGEIRSGEQVLIVGASGGVGTFAVQIAKWYGAQVTGVCSTRNLEMVRSIGADQVIDYTQEDFTKSGQRYDLILAVNGYHSLSAYKRALHPEGVYVMTGGSNAQMFQAMLLGPLISRTGRQQMGNSAHKPNKKDLNFMKELLEADKVVPVIDRRYTLSETAEAIRYLEKGHAQGKVVITVA